MLKSTKIIGVKNGQIKTSSSLTAQNQVKLTASRGGSGGFGGNMSVNTMFHTPFQYMLSGIVPADPHNTNSHALAGFYRDCYLYDNIAGSAVDIQSDFTFSDFELRGVSDSQLEVYDNEISRLGIKHMLAELSVSYLVDGFSCNSLIYDKDNRQFTDLVRYDAMQCQVYNSPFVNFDSPITVFPAASMQEFLASNSIYAEAYVDSLPKDFLHALNQGQITLEPLNTLFFARRTLPDRPFTSYLNRILPMYLIEKAMFRGTLTEAMKRQRATTHVTVGSEEWTPSREDLSEYLSLFQQSELDPLGGWIVTRDAVNVNDIRAAGDIWKWTEMAESLTGMKLRSLGISEALLSGDASFASAESAYTSLLERLNQYRSIMQHNVFERKLFPLIAVVNGFYKDLSKVKPIRTHKDLLNSIREVSNLNIPVIHWHKSLETTDEANVFEMLEAASEKGVPIPIKMWLAAANIDADALERDLKTDAEYTAYLNSLKGETETQTPEGQTDIFHHREESAVENNQHFQVTALSKSAPFTSKVGLNNREFNDHEFSTKTKLGKKAHVYHNRSGKQRDNNAFIAKLAVKIAEQLKEKEVWQDKQKRKKGWNV